MTKKQLWRFHSWLGLLAGLGLIVIGSTGSLLVFRGEIDALLGQAPPRVSVHARLASLDEVVGKVMRLHPDLEIYSWYGSERADEPQRITGTLRGNGQDCEIYFDPYTGALRETLAAPGAFTHWLLDLHDSLLLGTPGVVFAGVLAAALVLSGLSGAWLYQEFWRRFFTLRWRASARIFCSDLHKMIGISSVAFNLILGFTGAWWNLSSVGDLFSKTESAEIQKNVRPPLPMPLETMKSTAEAALPGFVARGLRWPSEGDGYIVRGAIPGDTPFFSGWGDEVHLDAKTGTVIRILDLRRAGVWTQIEDMMAPLHFGTFGGLPIRILWCLGGLTPGVLAVSGFLIWRSRQGRGPQRTAKN